MINITLVGQFDAYNNDPEFYLILSDIDPLNIPVSRGDILKIKDESLQTHKRIIVGANIDTYAFLGQRLSLIAPKQITKPNQYDKYVGFNDIELRPGTKIIGGKGSWFYDDIGIILSAYHTGGDMNKFEDWIYYVLARTGFQNIAPQWLILDNVGLPESPPYSITEFKTYSNNSLNALLNESEMELLEYYMKFPNKLDIIEPKELEKLINTIYRNNGFITENIGAWNQADGGVDILAISKNIGHEYRLAIQCKTSKNKISAKPIRELAGVLDVFKAHQGIVVTTSKFTKEAVEETEGSLWKITLQDRDDIMRKIMSILMPEHKDTINNHHKK